jgi:predicted RNase H-like nuclease (RuvC/YqgF family)
MVGIDEVMNGLNRLSEESRMTRQILEGTASRLDTRIQELNRTSQELHKSSMETTRELGGVQATLQSMKADNAKMDARINHIDQRQADCPARQDNKGINARLKRIENFKEKIQEERGEITGVTNNPREFATQPGLSAAGATVTMKDIIFKAGPFIVSALLLGAAVAGFLLKEYLSK